MKLKYLGLFIFLYLLVLTPDDASAQFGRGRGRGQGRGRGGGQGRNRFRGRGGGGRVFRNLLTLAVLSNAFGGGGGGRPQGGGFGSFAAGVLVGSQLGGRRGKRDVEFAPADDIENLEMEAAFTYWDLAFESDTDECLAETLCELMTDYEKKDSKAIVKILNTIYDSDIINMYSDEHKEAFAILEAGKLGKLSKMKSLCKQMYSSCKTDVNEREKELEESIKIAFAQASFVQV